MKGRLLQIGIGGSILAAICCFTPLLVWLLAGVGMTAALAYLDFILLPTLAFFLILTGYALWKRKQAQ